MKRIIARHYVHIISQAETMRVVVNIWNSYEDGKWNSLIRSMSAGMQAVIDTKGGSIPY